MSFKRDADPVWSMRKRDKLSKKEETSEGSRMKSVRLTNVRVEADLHLNWGRHEADVHGGNNELSETKNGGGD
ncbi:unnamed protein product [Prunus armeniaca]|uniref:Uncharacterized protein n=1 Tax=Prunus armeniaca TaxID=36596 RepID=A0A6J5TKU4_PRUAR|nr:unnamed protein product [Prunus armeniaca]